MTTVEARTIDSEEARVNEAIDKLLAEFPPATTDVVKFLGAQFDLGLAWVHFAEGDGGLAVNPKHQRVINERIFGAGGPNPYYRNPIGYGMCGPTVEVQGSDEQKKRYLRPLFTGEEVWCQLFSEPGAGSDFAGLSRPRRPRRRRVGRQRSEGVDDARPHLAVGPARVPHRSRRPQAQGPHRTSSSTCRRPASRCGRCVR